MYRKAAELLLDVADPLRTQLVFEKILPQVTTDGPEGALISSFSDEEIVQLLTTRVQLHDGALRAVSSSFRDLGLSLPRRESILEAIRKKAMTGGAQQEAYRQLFDTLSDSAELKMVPDSIISALEEEINAPTVSAQCLELTPEEASRVEQTMKCASLSQGIENIPAMLDLLRLETDAQRYITLLDVLETVRKTTLREARLDLALNIVKACAAEKQAKERSPEEREKCQRFLEEAVAEDTITFLADMALNCERSSPEYALILDYLRTVPEHAYHELLHRLEEEKSKTLRLAIRGLLVALGKTDIESLSLRVLDKRWFVARNAVSILGEIGGESAVEALAAALDHQEPRVRREALNALGKIGGESPANCLAAALEDNDSDVALCAARWLTMLGDVAPLDGLVSIVQSKKFRQADLEIVLSAVRAIARSDSSEATSFLRRAARRRISAFFGSGRCISACAAEALCKRRV
jgi:HEAT repeat protein